jgi:hypothetical protein
VRKNEARIDVELSRCIDAATGTQDKKQDQAQAA